VHFKIIKKILVKTVTLNPLIAGNDNNKQQQQIYQYLKKKTKNSVIVFFSIRIFLRVRQ